MIAEHIIERARAIRLENEIARRSILLKGKTDQSGPCPVCGGRDPFRRSHQNTKMALPPVQSGWW